MKQSEAQSAARQGFDAAVAQRKDDHLNRWPFAREISRIAGSGPKDWSVRVGIYGEWGTGKTTVLRFIAALAEKDDHVIVWFDPWEYSSKADLWRHFVLKVFKCLEDTMGGIAAAGDARRKSWLAKATGVVQTIGGAMAAAASDHAASAVDSGLELVRRHFTFGPDDLKALRELLGKKRIIILIDDLDRTAAELVPEILFALKELMDIPGFSFVCAFDPVVVGKILRQHHRGFGDGLKFLDKIIDYPRWLPPASQESLERLAIAEAKQSCKFVPEQALRDAVALLPSNPRAIRQFIRLLALLRPQIERHYDHELRWPVILAATVLKVRHPQVAHPLLQDDAFWGKIQETTILAKEEEVKAELEAAIAAHVDATAGSLRVALSPAERSEILNAMKILCSKVSVWSGGGAESLAYQLHLAETPHAVTWKEFDRFVAAWDRSPTPRSVAGWIARHSAKVEQPSPNVFHEILAAALNRYADVLRKAESVHRDKDKPTLLKQAQSLISILECLVLEVGGIESLEKQIGATEVDQIIESFATILKSNRPTLADFYARNELLLLNLVEGWHGDVAPLVSAVSPYGHFSSDRFDGEAARKLHKRLSSAVLPKLAAQMIDGFRHSNYVQRVWTYDKESVQIRSLFLLVSGPLWSGARKEALAVIQEAEANSVVHENIYELLLWFAHLLNEPSNKEDVPYLKKLFGDAELFGAIWGAAIANPLSRYATVRLNKLVLSLKAIDVTPNLPDWWSAAIAVIAPQNPPDEER